MRMGSACAGQNAASDANSATTPAARRHEKTRLETEKRDADKEFNTAILPLLDHSQWLSFQKREKDATLLYKIVR